MSWQQFQSINEVLRFEFERKTKRNTRYSLRAFARDIGLTPAHLNEILKGRSGLSEHKAEEVLSRLGATESEGEWFRLLVQKNYARDGHTRKVASTAMSKILTSRRKSTSVRREKFRLVSRWYHFAILELFSLKDFEPNAKSISAHLGISLTMAADALNNLVCANLVEKDVFGRLQITHSDSEVSSPQPEEAIRNYHREILTLAYDSINLSTDRRELGALTLAVRRNDFDSAIKRIREFRQSFNREFGVDREGDDVLCLSVQLFPLTKPGGSSESKN